MSRAFRGTLTKHMKACAEPGACVGFTLSPNDESLKVWSGVLIGTEGTPYEGGTFAFKMEMPDTYPFVLPTIFFAPLRPPLPPLSRCDWFLTPRTPHPRYLSGPSRPSFFSQLRSFTQTFRLMVNRAPLF
jgi:hypothetical protein